MKILLLAMASLISAPALVQGMSKLAPAKSKQSSRGGPPPPHPTSDVNDRLRKLSHPEFWGNSLLDGDWRVKNEIKPGDDFGFGWQVAITDDSQTMIVGSYYSGTDGCVNDDVASADLNAYGTGSARVYVRSTDPESPEWTLQGELIGDDGAGGVYGGYAVEIDGDTAIVSAFKLPCFGDLRIFIFVRDGTTGNWSQEEMLHTEYDSDGSNPYYDDGRVARVAIKGDTAVVGRPHVNKETETGYVHYVGDAIVYVRDGTTWSMQAQLEASDGELADREGDFFGADVDISTATTAGDTIIVGATQRNLKFYDATADRKGKAYVFKRTGTSWSQEAILLPGDDVYSDFMFGNSVALDYPTAVIGHGKENSWPDPSGIVYAHVFQYAGPGSWPLQAKLEHPNDDSENNEWDTVWGDHGSVVAIKGDLALVGNGETWGAILYERNGDIWEAKQLLESLNGAYSATTHHGNSRKLALTDTTAIMASDSGFGDIWWQPEDGSVNVFDNFSYLPLGPLDIQWTEHGGYFSSYRGQYILSGVVFFFGYGRNVELDLFQADCATRITDTEVHILEERVYMENFTYSVMSGAYEFDNTTITGSSIFDAESWNITLCAKLSLLSDSGLVEDTLEQVLSGFIDVSKSLYRPAGPLHVSYDSFGNWGSVVSVRYLAGVERTSRAMILQKDCVTPITDTEISFEMQKWPFNLTFEMLNPVYTYNSSTVGDSVIFNEGSSQLEVCSKVELVSESGTVEAFDTKVLLLDVVETRNGLVTGVNGDPHIITWDGLKFDCQAAGEFTTVTSLEDDTFKIQERFTEAKEDAQASVSTGIAFTDTSKPVIQISTPKSVNGQSSLNTVGSCPIDFYVDNEASTLDRDLSSSNVRVQVGEKTIKVEHTDTFLSVEVTVQTSNTFGCLFMVQVFLPGDFRPNETLLGLLGTPNGDISDEWKASDGTTLTPPATENDKLFAPAYDYCVQNWCIDNVADSLFSYGTDESFADFNKCDRAYDDTLESLLNNPDPVLAAICGDNIECLVDGSLGDISDAQQAIQNDAIIIQTQAIVNPPTPSMAPSTNPTVSMVPSGSSSTSPSMVPSGLSSTSPSMVPSVSPTTSPSVSMAPSGSPTTEAFGNARGAFNPNPNIDGSTELVVSVPTKAVLSPSTCTADTPLSDSSFTEKIELELKRAGCIAETKDAADNQCEVKISKMECQTSRRQLVRGQRGLQTSSLLIEFSTTITAYCQKGDCSDAQSIVDGIYDTVKLQLDEYLNADPGLIAGYINFLLTTNIFTNPSAVSSAITFGSVIVPILEDLLTWYPHWNSESETCKNDGQYPLYMKRLGSYFESSLADCCERYYSWAYNECLELGGGDADAVATDEFYVDYFTNSCVQDCPKDTPGKNCGGLAKGNWVGTYKTAKECCDGKLWWIDENSCIAESTKDASDLNVAQAGSGSYYVNWVEVKCVKDCAESPTDPQCGGLAKRWEPLFDSANSCCSSKLSYIDRSDCTR